ncbi:gluconeogenesis factor YvcK family protein [Romboutsia maritimum]|nr:gluconeogenesis factor YvcK family protein [Romboutsia maritimum]
MKAIFILIGIMGWIALIGSICIYLKIMKNKRQSLKMNNREYIGPKIVVIGGGTGQSVFLRGLKHFTQNITAVVTVADDGGGSGALREDLGMLPPGDIRNCLLALANIEPTMNEIMQYRFTEGALKGQSLGNLFLAAMNGLYGNFETAVYKMSEIFAITGRVLPVTLEDINLIAKLHNGSLIKGESSIPKEVKHQNSQIDKIYLYPKSAKPLEEVINSIQDADVIVMGPGSLYTSIIPNLLVKGVVSAIKKSNATKVYISNIMTQPGETDNYNVLNHIEGIIKHTEAGLVDYVIANNEILPNNIFSLYKRDGAEQVLLDENQREALKNMGIKVIEDNLIEIKNNYIRHDAKHISSIITNLSLSHIYDEDK